MLKWFERKLARFAIHNLTIYLVAGQAIFFLAHLANPALLDQMVLQPQRVLDGEWWRLLTFLFMPSSTSIIFIIFALYLLYLMGTALEHEWGAFRYNLYILLGYLATLAAVWVDLHGVATNAYLLASVFLAFAFLYPDFQLLLFFFWPVKIKWLALLTWVFYGYTLLAGDLLARTLVLAAVFNFLVFFGPQLLRTLRLNLRRSRARDALAVEHDVPFHRCSTCGRTDRTDPQLEFRYCPSCLGSACYCMDHIHNHTHR
jgi:hypothetical protein